MIKASKLTTGLLFVALGACGGADSMEPQGTTAAVKNKPASDTVEECVPGCDPLVEGQQVEDGNSGTGLCATAQTRCVDGVLTVSGTLASSGSVDSAVVTLEDGSEVQIGTLQPQDFIHDGRVKFACFEFGVDLEELQIDPAEIDKVCFTQSGAQGREPKRTCNDVDLAGCVKEPPHECPPSESW